MNFRKNFIIFFFQVKYFVDSDDDCYYTVSSLSCAIFRIPFFSSVIALALFHVALCVERSIATFYLDSYQRYRATLGTVLVLLAVILNLLKNFVLYMQKHRFT